VVASAAAEQFQVDAKTVRTWRDWFVAEWAAGLRDRSSRSWRSPNKTSQRVCNARCRRCTAATGGELTRSPIGCSWHRQRFKESCSTNGPTLDSGVPANIGYRPGAASFTPQSRSTTRTTDHTARSAGEPPPKRSGTTSATDTTRDPCEAAADELGTGDPGGDSEVVLDWARPETRCPGKAVGYVDLAVLSSSCPGRRRLTMLSPSLV
jgi:hypothetical protein